MKKNYLLKVMALLMTLLLMCMPMKTFAAEEEEKIQTEYSQARSNPYYLKRKITFISIFQKLKLLQDMEVEVIDFRSITMMLRHHMVIVQVLPLLWIQVYDAISQSMFMALTSGIRNMIYMSKETRHTIYMDREYSEHQILYGQQLEEHFMLLMMKVRDILNWLTRTIIK